MIETIVLNWLLSGGFAAYMEEPLQMPTTPYLLVEKVGGGENNHIQTARMVVQSYADSKADAAALNLRVIARMQALVEHDRVTRVNRVSDYDYTDKETKRYRYQALFEVIYY